MAKTAIRKQPTPNLRDAPLARGNGAPNGSGGRAHKANGRIDEQAQMRIIDLNNGNAFVAEQLDLAANDRHAVAHEILAFRISVA